MQELAATRKRLEDLQVSQTSEAHRVWDVLGQTETALVPLGFGPLHSGIPAQEVDVMLPLLDSAEVMMSYLEDIIGGRLEVKGCILAEVVAEHMLMCFRSWDPEVSLELVVQGPLKRLRRMPRSMSGTL
jgi:hypothetical protein